MSDFTKVIIKDYTPDYTPVFRTVVIRKFPIPVPWGYGTRWYGRFYGHT